jgi:hypothetical protein
VGVLVIGKNVTLSCSGLKQNTAGFSDGSPVVMVIVPMTIFGLIEFLFQIRSHLDALCERFQFLKVVRKNYGQSGRYES